MKNNRQIIRCIIIIAIVAILAWWIIESRIRASQFCTQNDEVYQAILDNLNSWVQHFPNNSEPTLHFKTYSGREYLVNAIYWETKEQSPLLFIPTVPKTRELFGYAGYAYSPSGLASPDGRYTSEYLSNDIYCYRFTS
jgi:hypothetical protein